MFCCGYFLFADNYHFFGNGDWNPQGQSRLQMRPSSSGNSHDYTITMGASASPHLRCTPDQDSLRNNWHFLAGQCVQGSGGGGGRCMLYWDGQKCSETGPWPAGSSVPARFTVGARSDSLNEAVTSGAKIANLAMWFTPIDCSGTGTCVVPGLPGEDDFDKLWELTRELYGK